MVNGQAGAPARSSQWAVVRWVTVRALTLALSRRRGDAGSRPSGDALRRKDPTKDSQPSYEAADHAFHTRHARQSLQFPLISSHFLLLQNIPCHSLSFPVISSHFLSFPQNSLQNQASTRTRIGQFMQQTDKFVSQTDEFGRNSSLFRHPNLRQPDSPFGATRDSAIASDTHYPLPTTDWPLQQLDMLVFPPLIEMARLVDRPPQPQPQGDAHDAGRRAEKGDLRQQRHVDHRGHGKTQQQR